MGKINKSVSEMGEKDEKKSDEKRFEDLTEEEISKVMKDIREGYTDKAERDRMAQDFVDGLNSQD
ncbi:MAG: hypothetical protein R6V40_03915 [Candidatus Moraniibacteriota bacterium]